MATTREGPRTYGLGRDRRGGWWLLVARGARVAAPMPLDHDRRHARLFLATGDQRAVGVGGLVALERLSRRVLRG